MRRVLLLSLILGLLALPSTPAAQAIRNTNGSLLSCPDPSVLDARVGGYQYHLVCTSDYAANAYPIRGSNDMVHWHLIGYVFPAGHQPWWALHSPEGHYWAPAIYRIDGRWVVYFAAQTNPKAVRVPYAGGLPTFVVGVATSRSLRGPWFSKILHYRGQFNGLDREQERYGGVIDPSQVQDPATGQRYLFWAEQHSSIWVSQLSGDGLTLSPLVHQALWAEQKWECLTPTGSCVVEGPEEAYHDGQLYLFYSGASTWAGTYAVGAAVSSNPLEGLFTPLSINPILRSTPRWLGPGGSSAPITGPNGQTYLFYHVLTRPDTRRVSADRYLFVSPLNWIGLGGVQPLVNHGQAG